ncbi:uncharacterized protein B0H18DRAFT_886503 [Fomitopsis serialis]|uniref:uncharacterized protein n=1 Tax=Fomitopsis serialis TaxID=139415 RepID=UPI0020079092|nr:uncharacterized protein B0H18DRAFT_886503 [Neoantrodia serialis]KAH9914942.1 hypothetical protein B0H18DRAFT_886503 [Neoantrodia serialis]
MTDAAYAGKSNEQIINEQAASLEEKSHYQHGARFHPGGATSTSLKSGVNESGVEGFPTTSGMEQVSVGRRRERPGALNLEGIRSRDTDVQRRIVDPPTGGW